MFVIMAGQEKKEGGKEAVWEHIAVNYQKSFNNPHYYK